MSLQRLHARNFRLLQDVAIEFFPDLTVLIGPNNAGKSNIVDALLFLKQGTDYLMSQVLDLRGGFERVVSRHRRDEMINLKMLVQIREHGAAEYSVTISKEGLNEETTKLEDNVLSARREGGGLTYDIAGPGGRRGLGGYGGDIRLIQPRPPELNPVWEFLNGIVHVDPFRQIAFQSGIGLKTMVEKTGSDLATVLHYHYNNDRDRFDAYEDIVRTVLPEIEMIETPVLSENTATVSLRFAGDATKYNLWQISSGLKDVLVLLAAAHFARANSLIIIEEPENHLHPAAQKAFCAVIQRAADSEGKQFILTTHSETILGQFGPERAIFVDKVGPKAEAIPLKKVEPYVIWEKMGLDRTALVEVLGRAPQILVIVEGRRDYQALEPLWDYAGLKDKVLCVRAEGGGWEEIVDWAAALRDALARFRIRSEPFVLLDGDGDRDGKIAHLAARGFPDAKSHVWSQEEIESYLLLPEALRAISGRGPEEVRRAIAETGGRGKARYEEVLQRLGIGLTPPHLITGNTIRNNPGEIPSEMFDLVNKVRGLLGMPPL